MNSADSTSNKSSSGPRQVCNSFEAIALENNSYGEGGLRLFECCRALNVKRCGAGDAAVVGSRSAGGRLRTARVAVRSRPRARRRPRPPPRRTRPAEIDTPRPNHRRARRGPHPHAHTLTASKRTPHAYMHSHDRLDFFKFSSVTLQSSKSKL